MIHPGHSPRQRCHGWECHVITGTESYKVVPLKGSALATGTQTAVATSGFPAVTLPSDGAFVFCSAPGCTGTCEVTDVAYISEGEGEGAPGGMKFESIYWYDPGNYRWILYTCVDYYDCNAVQIGPNQCYNLLENGVPTGFDEYWYLVGP